MPRRVIAGVAVAVACLAGSHGLTTAAEPRWTEMRSPNFLVVSNASDGSTRTLAWQMEQIRSTIASVWPWTRVELSTPVVVLVVKDEASMKAIAPAYWERKGGVRPVSVSITGPDRHYIAIRADVRNEDTETINPHSAAYFSYAATIITASFDARLPVWFLRGFAGVLSNTIVRNSDVLIGAPIPWHIQTLREGRRLPLAQVIAVTRNSPEYTQSDQLTTLDAQAWAFVHFLMFGENGKHREKLDRFAASLTTIADPVVAFRETVGRPEDYEVAFNNYIARDLFAASKTTVDMRVKRDAFTVRTLSVAEGATVRATFYATSRRPVEAREAIAAARAADANEAESYVAEAMLLERDGRRDDARAALAKAVERGSSNAYAHFRFAVLSWGPNTDRNALPAIEKAFERATTLNERYASAYVSLGEVRAALGNAEAAVSAAQRAIQLEPNEARHYLAAARVLLRLRSPEEARKVLQRAVTLAQSEDVRREADRLIALADQARKPGH